MLTSPDALAATTPSTPPPDAKDPRAFIAVAAAAVPPLLAYNVAPSPTLLNQVLALGLWGWFVAVLAVFSGASAGQAARSAASLLAALGLMALAVMWSWGPGLLPSTFALSALGLLAAAAVMVISGAQARAQALDPRVPAVTLFAWFCLGWVVVGACNVVIALVQVFAPEWADGHLIARSALPGRATGNLRQPNHLASLLMWSAIAVVALLELRRIAWRSAAVLMSSLVFAVLLSGSRTGMVGVALLALWGLADRKLARPARGLLLGAPVVYALAWWGMSLWAGDNVQRFGGAARLQEADLSSSRFGIWSNTLALIRDHPWTGVGFGEFNLAWTLTPLPGRPTALFDHTHNLPLHLAVELGLPLAMAVMGLLVWALWRAGRSAWTTAGEAGAAQRAAFAMVTMIGLHSLLEYPLWYSYFLLPTAWAWGWAVGTPGPPPSGASRRRAPLLLWAGVALVVGAALTLVDYLRVVAIFQPRPAVPLAQRIEDGRKSVLFGHHGDYAAATSPWREATLPEFARTTHHLLDARLMMAWAQALAREGRWDEARHVAARLAEFRNPLAEAFFAPCAGPGGSGSAGAQPAAQPQPAGLPREIVCDPPRQLHRWQDLAAPTPAAAP